MGNSWEGDLYDDFAKKLRSNLTHIRAQLERAQTLKLELDQTAVDLKMIIDIFASAAEG
jgi:hypothetical protein